MAREINTRLEQLETRRKGTDRLGRMAVDARSDVLAKSYLTEDWQRRVPNQPFTRYAIGSMQEVGLDYTRISLETARRVGNQLQQSLTSAGFVVDFRLQGSVPLNVHIRGVSDVDLLNFDNSFITYELSGAWSQAGLYSTPTPLSSIGVLSTLRIEAEKVLREKYPAATVDCSGGKAITISGGSLARPVDVVVSHWHDGVNYQNSGQEHDRVVTIFDRKLSKTVDNLPFLHIKRVNDRDNSTLGGLKKAIRLCKNVKSDSEREILLPSFDLAATMFHADQAALRANTLYELAILAETQRFLDFLHLNKEYAKTLSVPDGSRLIFNSDEKLAALTLLSIEMDDLLRDVAKEQSFLLYYQDRPALSDSREAISSLNVPL